MNPAPAVVRLLHLDDNPGDARLLAYTLEEMREREGLDFRISYVSTREEYLEALKRKDFDVILSDYRMPGFDGDQALQAAQEVCPEVPFIMVTGELGEDRAIETLKRGAWDYVLKDNMLRLVPSIRRALAEAESARKRREAEAEVRQAHRQTTEILESIQDAFYTVDGEWRITYVNRQAERFWGRKRRELLGRNLWEEFPEEAGARARRQLMQAMEERRAVHFEEISPVSKRWVDVHVYPGSEGGLTVYFRDIDDRKHAESLLRRSETQYQTLFDNMAEEVHFWQLVRDDQGRIQTWRLVDANPPALRTWGKTLAEIRGKTTDEIFGPGSTDHYLPVVQKVMSDGVPLSYEDYFPNLDRYFRFTTVPLGDHFITTGADISSLKHAQQLAERQRAEMEALYDSAPIGLCVLDTQLRWVRLNAMMAGMNGLPVEAHLGRTVREVLPNLADQAETAARKLLETGEPLDFEITGTTAAQPGVVRSWRERWVPLRDEQGKIIGISVAARETTEQKRADVEIRRLTSELEARVRERTEQLEAANRELEAFTSTVSHDLRAPLRLISGYASVLLQRAARGQPPQEDEGDFLQHISDGAAQMDQLISSLLEFSRLSQKSLQKAPVDMGRLVRSVIVEQQEQQQPRDAGSGSPERRVRVIVEEMPEVVADPVLIRQVMANLISNAFKYTRRSLEPRIEISAFPGNRDWTFVVRDNGVGFPAAQAGKLFQVFQRLHAERDFEGTGIGLANVRKIVERHGGRVWAVGEEGKGAAFYFTLPRSHSGAG